MSAARELHRICEDDWTRNSDGRSRTSANPYVPGSYKLYRKCKKSVRCDVAPFLFAGAERGEHTENETYDDSTSVGL